MLKFPIFKLLNEFIGEYLINFSKEQMTLQLNEKTMGFSNLILNPKKVNEKLDSLSLFCNLKSGMIKELKIEVLSIMESKDLKISLKELYVIMGPNLSYLTSLEEKMDFNKELENLRKKAKEPKNNKFSLLKSMFLEKVLLKSAKKKDTPKKEKGNPSERDKLIFEVFRNIKISIEGFHLRYEDDQITNPIAFGLTVDEIQVLSSEKNNLQEFNDKSQFVYHNIESKANIKSGKSKNLIMKTLILNKVMCYFNTKSELYIPNSLYEHTKTSKKGIFEAINYFDLECYMKMYFNQNEQKYVLKLFEIQGRIQIDLTLYSDDLVLNPEENVYLVNLASETISMKIQKEALEEMCHLLDFIRTYDLLEIMAHFKPKIKPLVNCPDKTLSKSIAREWFELAIWFNRLIAYRDSQRLDLIENSLLVSAHINNLSKRPNIMKSLNKLIDSPWHMAFHTSFMYLKLQILDNWQKVLEIQIQEPAFDLAINQTPNSLSVSAKTVSLQVIAMETEEFEPERYEAPFTIPIFFEKNPNVKKKIFEDNTSIEKKEKKAPSASVISLKNGMSLTFITSGLDLDGKTLDFKLNLKPIDIFLRQSGIIKLHSVLKNFLSIPYINRKKPIIFLQKRILLIMDAVKNGDRPEKTASGKKNEATGGELQGFEKVVLEDIKQEKSNTSPEKNGIGDPNYKKYELVKENAKKTNESSGNWLQRGKIIYEEMMNLRNKALKKQKREKILDFKENLKRLGVFVIVDYKEVEFKLERTAKSNPIVTHFAIPEGKISAAFNQPQTDLNFVSFGGIRVEFNKDLDYLFDLLLKLL